MTFINDDGFQVEEKLFNRFKNLDHTLKHLTSLIVLTVLGEWSELEKKHLKLGCYVYCDYMVWNLLRNYLSIKLSTLWLLPEVITCHFWRSMRINENGLALKATSLQVSVLNSCRPGCKIKALFLIRCYSASRSQVQIIKFYSIEISPRGSPQIHSSGFMPLPDS